MAKISFGTTARGSNALAVLNTGTSDMVISALRCTVPANGYQYFTFDYFDELFDSMNFRDDNLYQVNSDGSQYLSDVAQLANLIVATTLVFHAATYTPATGVYALGSALSFTHTVDGSVTFA